MNRFARKYLRDEMKRNGCVTAASAPAMILIFLMLLLSMLLSFGRSAYGAGAAIPVEDMSVSLCVGGTYPVSSVLVPENDSGKDALSLTWTSSDKSVAKVSGGSMIGTGAGKAVLTGKSKDQTFFRINVTVTAGKISLNAKSVKIAAGKKFTLKAISSGRKVSVRFKSSNRKIATVSKKGVVKAKKPGKVTITAYSGKKTAKCVFRVKASGSTAYSKKFTVNKAGLAVYLEMNAGSLVLPKKSTYTLWAVYSTGNGKKLKASFSSSNPSVASVSKSGKVRAKKTGTAVIKAKYKNMTCTCKVKVIKKGSKSAAVRYTLNKKSRAKKLQINITSVTTAPGRSYQLICAWDGKKAGASFKSSDSKVAPVSKDGMVTAKKSGKAVITGTYKGMTASCTLTVKTDSIRTTTITEQFEISSQGKYTEKAKTVSYRSYPTVVAAGSSSIALWKNIKSAFPGCNVINTAIGGTTADQWLKWYYPEKILQYEPDAVLVYVGQNNIGNHETADLSQGKDTGDKVVELLGKLHEALPDRPVFYVSICQVPCKDNARKEISRANTIIKSYCDSTKNVCWIDINPYFFNAGTGNYATSLFAEKTFARMLHPSAKGYEVWKKAVGLFISRMLYS